MVPKNLRTYRRPGHKRTDPTFVKDAPTVRTHPGPSVPDWWRTAK